MAGPGVRRCLGYVTAYLLLLVAVSALGPLQFGLHLVSRRPSLHLVHEPPTTHPHPRRFF